MNRPLTLIHSFCGQSSDSHQRCPLCTTLGKVGVSVPRSSATLGKVEVLVPRSSVTLGKVEVSVSRSSATFGKVGVTVPRSSVTLGKVGVLVPRSSVTFGKVEVSVPRSSVTLGKVGPDSRPFPLPLPARVGSIMKANPLYRVIERAFFVAFLN